jgi:hypothetical protein
MYLNIMLLTFKCLAQLLVNMKLKEKSINTYPEKSFMSMFPCYTFYALDHIMFASC